MVKHYISPSTSSLIMDNLNTSRTEICKSLEPSHLMLNATLTKAAVTACKMISCIINHTFTEMFNF